jgi:hypothetical protein
MRSKRHQDDRERRNRERDGGSGEPHDQWSGELVKASAAERLGATLLPDRTNDQDGNGEQTVAQTEDPEWPPGPGGQTWKHPADSDRDGSGAEPGAPPGKPGPLSGEPRAPRRVGGVRSGGWLTCRGVDPASTAPVTPPVILRIG